MLLVPLPLMWTARIQAPIPRGKNQNIACPQSHRSTQELCRWVLLIWQSRNQSSKRPNDRGGNHGQSGNSEAEIQLSASCQMEADRGNQQNGN